MKFGAAALHRHQGKGRHTMVPSFRWAISTKERKPRFRPPDATMRCFLSGETFSPVSTNCNATFQLPSSKKQGPVSGTFGANLATKAF